MPPEEHHLLSKNEIEAIATKAAQKAVEQTLTGLGFDSRNAIEAQADMRFLRRMRLGVDATAIKIGLTVIGLIVVAVAGLMTVGFVTWIHSSRQ